MASTSNDAEFFFTYEDLPLLDPDKILNEYVDWTDTLEWPTSSKEESKTKRLADKQGDPEEKPGIVGAFCRAYTIEEAISTFIPDLYENILLTVIPIMKVQLQVDWCYTKITSLPILIIIRIPLAVCL